MFRQTAVSLMIALFQILFSSTAWASEFNVSFDKEKNIIIISAGKEEIEIRPVNDDCEIIDEGNNYGFKNCQIKIGELSMSKVSAEIGAEGAGFSLDGGFDIASDFKLKAGSLQLALMTGEKLRDVVELPEFIGKLDDEAIYLFTDVSTSINLVIDGNVISLPSPASVSASLLLDTTGELFFYSGPIPSPTMIADGANKFLKSASASADKDKSMLSGSFGYSIKPKFKYSSSFPVYTSSKKEPEEEKFNANVVMIGEFELADFASIEGNLFLDVKKGKLGINAGASVGFDMFGAGVSLDVAEGTFIVDGKGVRFGLGSSPSDGLPKYISQFAAPMLKANASAYGLAKSNSDFLIQIDVEDVSASGVDSIDGSFKIAPSGLDVGAKFKLDGVGKVKVSGEITNSECALTAEKIKIFNLFTIKDARIEFCKMAKEGAYAFAGELKVLGIPAKVNGLADAADSAASVLSKDVKFSDDFEVKKKFGVGGSGIAGGYVKLTASGDVDVLMNAASGKLSSDVGLEAKAKFCGKVKIAGFKRKKCSSTKSGISNSFDVEVGCFTFDAEKKILGQKFKIDAGKVCPFPAVNEDKSTYEEDDLESDGDQLDEDDLGVVVALRDHDGEYVSWTDDLMLTTTKDLGDTTYFTLLNKDGSECPKDGTKIAVQLGDGTDEDLENYWRVKKDKSSALNAESGDEDSGTKAKKRFIIYAVDMANECLSDGDTIRLKNKEYGRWVSSASKPLVAYNSSGGDDKIFTVVFEPKE
ncbi:MAG: hypothetical protein CMM24_09075 [Rhodospirillaceae bacterium]|nr:hypothetical protein [Rhodospirillaceae bacterium]